MTKQVFKNYQEMSEATANMIIETIKAKPTAAICIASGDTPKLTLNILVERILSENIDISSCKFFALDEWVGISPENPGSCFYFLNEYFKKPLKLSDSQFYNFDYQESNIKSETLRIDNLIFEAGGLDLILLGIGPNGHLGLNEPGVDFNNYCHSMPLAESTITTAEKYFGEKANLSFGITIGIKHIMESKTVILIANGLKKANIIKTIQEAEISNTIPATVLRTHQNSFLIIDEEANMCG